MLEDFCWAGSRQKCWGGGGGVAGNGPARGGMESFVTGPVTGAELTARLAGQVCSTAATQVQQAKTVARGFF